MFCMTKGVNVFACVRVSVRVRACVCWDFLSFGCELEWTGFVSVWTDKRSRLYPSLITLLRANIPFVFFPHFHSSSLFVVAGLGRGSATYQLSFSLVLHLLVCISSRFFVPQLLKTLVYPVSTLSLRETTDRVHSKQLTIKTFKIHEVFEIF